MNFGGIYPECSLRDAQFVVIPVPYDLTSTYQPGSRRGPAAIIEASTNMELYDEELKKETYLAGIHTASPVSVDARGPKYMIRAVRKKSAVWFCKQDTGHAGRRAQHQPGRGAGRRPKNIRN